MMNFRKVILLLVGETVLNLMVSESIQLSSNIDVNTLFNDNDDDDEKQCKIIHEVLSEISDGSIKSVHISQNKAKMYLKIIDDVLEGKAQIISPCDNMF
jgi:hypothetical protein